jgi:hypothetical protein
MSGYEKIGWQAKAPAPQEHKLLLARQGGTDAFVCQPDDLMLHGKRDVKRILTQ